MTIRIPKDLTKLRKKFNRELIEIGAQIETATSHRVAKIVDTIAWKGNKVKISYHTTPTHNFVLATKRRQLAVKRKLGVL